MYLRIAEVLADDSEDDSPNEALYRTAISRAYYAAFHTAKIYLHDIDGMRNIPRKNVHQFVREKFITHAMGGNYHRVGRNLEEMVDKRNKADYDALFPHLPDIAKRTVRKARDTIELIDHLQG